MRDQTALHLVLTVEAVGHYIKDFDRKAELEFTVKDAGDLDLTAALTDATLAVERGNTANRLAFKDSKKGSEGSLAWDPVARTMTLTYSEGTMVVLGVDPPPAAK